jgi:hypothetical protein
LSEYLSNTSLEGYHAQGFVGDSKYVLPLHRLPVVPGHITRRLAICQTETTVNCLEVYVQCHMPNYKTAGLLGSMLLSRYISIVITNMDKHQFVPFKPVIYPCKDTLTYSNDPPSLGNRVSIYSMTGQVLAVAHNGRNYNVPTTCNTKNYRRPCGLGSTLVTNNVVLMYPDVQQYMVPTSLRTSDETYLGFLPRGFFRRQREVRQLSTYVTVPGFTPPFRAYIVLRVFPSKQFHFSADTLIVNSIEYGDGSGKVLSHFNLQLIAIVEKATLHDVLLRLCCELAMDASLRCWRNFPLVPAIAIYLQHGSRVGASLSLWR